MSGKIIGSFNLPTPKAHVTNVISKVRESGQTDDVIIAAVLADSNYVLKAGDMLTILDMNGSDIVGEVAYAYDGTEFKPLNYALDASKVYLSSDITCAGSYSQVGNVTKTTTGTTTIAAEGKSVMEVLQTIFTKKLQPTITASPAVNTNFKHNQSSTVEAGTHIDSISWSNATYTTGSYTYGPSPTGVDSDGLNCPIERVATPSTFSGVVLSNATASGSDTNDGAGFTFGDQGETTVISSLAYKYTANYNAGDIAYDNLGGESDPNVQIPAGSVSKTTSAITPFRKYFYGTKTGQDDTIDTTLVRSLTHSTVAAKSGTAFSMAVPAGATRVVIAFPATLSSSAPTVADQNAFGTDIGGTFTYYKVNVEGANGYTAIPYHVWVLDSGIALAANTYKVTLK